jgi:uncharacterized protein with HEPN domain
VVVGQPQLLFHIHDEMAFLIEHTQGITEESFLENETLKRAFARCLEVIGEAVKNLSTDMITRNSDIEWRNMAGMRDKLIHGYFSVDYSLVWDVAVSKIPELKTKIELLIEKSRP